MKKLSEINHFWLHHESQKDFELAVNKDRIKQRKCLRCTKSFESYGPQNRICSDCLSHVEDLLDGYDKICLHK